LKNAESIGRTEIQVFNFIDQFFFTWGVVVLPVAYHALAFSGRRFQRRARSICRNGRAYALVFEYALVILFFAGLVGTLLLYYPKLAGSLATYSVDLDEIVSSLKIRVTTANLQLVRWCLLGLGGWFIVLGVLCGVLGNRDYFENVDHALRHYIRRRKTLRAATYTSVGAVVTTVCHVAERSDLDGWDKRVASLHDTLLHIDEVFLTSRQGRNVRMVLESSAVIHQYWRFGAHAYLVAKSRGSSSLEARGPSRIGLWGWLPRTSAVTEFRGLIDSIRSIASVHGRSPR
jgi:hypothetical protein